MFRTYVSAAFFVCSSPLFTNQSALSQETPAIQSTLLPTQATSDLIKGLPEIGIKAWAAHDSTTARELVVDQTNLSEAGKQRMEMSGDEGKTVPFVVPNSMIIKFEANVTPAQVEDYLKTNDLPVIQKFETIGAVQVKTDISKYFQSELTDNSVNDTILRGMNEAIVDFKKDPRVLSATPDIFLSDKAAPEDELEIRNMVSPTDIGQAATIDWGIKDVEADQLWQLPGATDGVIFGVMDVGFARHEDISYLDFPNGASADNHGNHVAGIACGIHNGTGIDGVLPNCFVRARAGDVFFQSAGSNPQLGFMVLFSQILATLDSFVGGQDDVSTFNVSLGYNWRSNFGINPDLPESSQWRTLVEAQGVILVSILEAANEDGKVIFSAAGNDSRRDETPIKAQYASPFNWAAIAARQKGINNGVIVAAHDAAGKRASFSNSGGDISCPGVDILSTLAFDQDLKPSTKSYGKMSGTSMASPYCASSHVLFRLVRPGYTGVEAFNCMMSSGIPEDTGLPMLKLTKAIEACPPRG
ncbi:S8 family serine peptidase [Rhizobium laguerreae]|uniref:S8 family peptidase n=1 Tax=Rhizobium laguerreae TaxID=1076926 RepID=UPI001C8FAFD7|nr:S8 family serine peptidase [Rhizobium laguerreae]MBY3181363.1 S8 family serine peptidase [Rhizobium laguerreae]